jgi:hypothetical protein
MEEYLLNVCRGVDMDRVFIVYPSMGEVFNKSSISERLG